MERQKVGVASNLEKVSEIIDVNGNKLDKIKGNIIEEKKVFNMSDIPSVEVGQEEPAKDKIDEMLTNSLTSKLEDKISKKINEIIDKKIDDILSKII